MPLVIVGKAPCRHMKFSKTEHIPLSSAIGDRLARYAGLANWRELHAHADVVNLIPFYPGSGPTGDYCPPDLARRGASIVRPMLKGRRVLFLGQGTLEAFGQSAGSYLMWHDFGEFIGAVIPTPTGRCNWFDSITNVENTCAFLSEIVAGVPTAAYSLP